MWIPPLGWFGGIRTRNLPVPRVKWVWRTWGCGMGTGFCSETAAQPTAGSSLVLPVRNEWRENAAFWGWATNASNIYCQDIFIANYMHMKQDLIPDLKSHQARKGVKTGYLKGQSRRMQERGGYARNRDWGVYGSRSSSDGWAYDFRRGVWLLEKAHLNAAPEVLSGGASGWPQLVLRLNITIRAFTWHEAPS